MGQVIEVDRQAWDFLRKVKGSMKWLDNQKDPKYTDAIRMERKIYRHTIKLLNGQPSDLEDEE